MTPRQASWSIPTQRNWLCKRGLYQSPFLLLVSQRHGFNPLCVSSREAEFESGTQKSLDTWLV
jgi:hypothetical protein